MPFRPLFPYVLDLLKSLCQKGLKKLLLKSGSIFSKRTHGNKEWKGIGLEGEQPHRKRTLFTYVPFLPNCAFQRNVGDIFDNCRDIFQFQVIKLHYQ